MINIVTTVYNAENYLHKCIGSIMGQSIDNFKCYITDDMSTDNSVSIIKDLIDGDDRFVLIENTTKMYQPGNYDQVIRNNENINDNDIIVEVDGDDWFPNSNVLKRITEVYSDENIWIANGSFKYSDGRKGFAAPPNNISNIRRETFTASHLRTWRAFLWRNIKEEDLMDETGNYWKTAGDLAFMFPMIEMAGKEHYKFMEEINYIYNEENPINDHKVNLSSVNEIVVRLRNKEPYKKLIK
jgi:glycosyltransferase involved in cell wall biosynthesis